MGTYVIVHGVLGLHSTASLARLPLSDNLPEHPAGSPMTLGNMRELG
jgi:hypothetical protein